MLDFSVLVRDEDGRRKSGRRRRRRGLSSVRSKPWKLETTSVRLDLAWSASQLWYGAVPLPLTIGFSALLSSSYRFFLSAKISLQSPLTGDISGRFSVFPFLSFPFLSFPSLPFPSLSSFLPSFLRFLRFQCLRSWGAAFLSIRAWRKIRYRLSLFLWFQPLREISFSLNHRRMEELRSFGVDIHLSFTKVVARFANLLSHIRYFSLRLLTRFFFPFFLPSFLPFFLSFLYFLLP